MALVDGSRVDEGDAFPGNECVVPKLFTLMLDSARPVPGDRRLYYFPKTPSGPRFRAVWVQGVVVYASGDGSRLVVDDGSGPPVVAVLSPDAATHSFRQSEFEARRTGVGAYVAVVGEVCGSAEVVSGSDVPETKARYALRVSRAHDLSNETERESMWNVEVVEAFRVLELSCRQSPGGGAE